MRSEQLLGGEEQGGAGRSREQQGGVGGVGRSRGVYGGGGRSRVTEEAETYRCVHRMRICGKKNVFLK